MTRKQTQRCYMLTPQRGNVMFSLLTLSLVLVTM